MSKLDEQLLQFKQEEQELQFLTFDNQTALELGLLLYEEVKKAGKSISIDITRNGHCLFHFAMDGTSIDNAKWIQRKNNIVNRFGKSSFHIGTYLHSLDTTLEEKYGISSSEFAAHGGAFPLIIKGVGPIGTITVSGLLQKDDHELVVRTIRAYLSKA